MHVIGIDVSKARLDCLWIRDFETGKVKSKAIKNSRQGHNELLEWAERNTGADRQEILFIMESTGIYHEALAYCLHDAGARVVVMNPAQIRDYARSLGARTKNDKKDSYVLARYGLTQQPSLWQPEPKKVRVLKALIARLDAVEEDIQREQNRLEKAEISDASAEVVESIRKVLQALEREKARLEQLIDDHIDQNPDLKKDVELLRKIPGVGPVVSLRMLATLRSRSFQRASQCAAYLGLVPVEYQSGSSIARRPRLSKAGNPKVRAKLYMAAIVASQHNPDVRALYERLIQRGKCKMSALGAAMRKLVHICFGVLKHQQEYRPQAVPMPA